MKKQKIYYRRIGREINNTKDWKTCKMLSAFLTLLFSGIYIFISVFGSIANHYFPEDTNNFSFETAIIYFILLLIPLIIIFIGYFSNSHIKYQKVTITEK